MEFRSGVFVRPDGPGVLSDGIPEACRAVSAGITGTDPTQERLDDRGACRGARTQGFAALLEPVALGCGQVTRIESHLRDGAFSLARSGSDCRSTGFAKKGTKSVGVQRQYSGTLGRVDNCQIATFLAYVTPDRDRVLLDRRLYLPKESWLADRARCDEAGVPADTEFITRPQQVSEMIDAARAAAVPFAWFTADEEFGQNPGLREYLETADISYVMAVPKTTVVTDTGGRETQIQHLATKLNHTAWQRRACGIGSKGFRVYDWALIPAASTHHEYMIRRSIDNGELAFYHCYNPGHAGFGELVNVAGARWPVEECFGAAKNEVGLDEYQVRKYDAWHRHITLAMLAHSFLAITAHHAKKNAANQAGS